MDRKKGRDLIVRAPLHSFSSLTPDKSPEHGQRQLFSREALSLAGRHEFIVCGEPGRHDRKRVIVVASPRMRRLIADLERAAPTSGTIFFHGESGSGKNLLAKLVHLLSTRKDGPFVQFSVGHHPDNLIESELFGHEIGAFTGALCAKPGKLELANRGTLFVDEVGDLAPSAQLKLHRFLDDRIVERVGGNEPLSVDVRLITATHRDLWALVKAGKFREDLYYRLNVVSLQVPPLRERREEIPIIAELLLEELSTTHGKPWLRWEPPVLDQMVRLPWPGNIRDLRNIVERMVILSAGETLTLDDLFMAVTSSSTQKPVVQVDSKEDEKLRFLDLYERCQGIRAELAREWGTSRTQVRRLIKRYLPEGLDQRP